MSDFSSRAIVLRRIAYGDHDLVVKFFTLNHGKMAAIAKSAKKSRKRFAGLLEPFTELDILCSPGRRRGMPVLKEAAMVRAFAGIRGDIEKTAYASYWAEIVSDWLEEGVEQPAAYHLLRYVLDRLDRGETAAADLSILFQMRFLSLAGLAPHLEGCGACRRKTEDFEDTVFGFDFSGGGLVCRNCRPGAAVRGELARGTIKQLLWAGKMALPQAERVRFSAASREEGLAFLEAFVPYHLGKIPKSLRVLRQLRERALPAGPPRGAPRAASVEKVHPGSEDAPFRD